METSKLFFNAPEFNVWHTEESFREAFDRPFVSSGWYYLPNDTTVLAIEKLGKIKCWAWIGPDVREEMEKILDLPKITETD
jgi:hypothetical protein